MKTLRLDTAELDLDFNALLKLATAIAEHQLGWDYALNRGARLAVEFDAGRFFFCFL